MKTGFSDKILAFIHSTLIKFIPTDKVKGLPISKNYLGKIRGIMNNQTHIHHSHVPGEITGYVHSFCNWKVRENKSKITVIALNLFRFNFFFLLKGLRDGVWKTRDISIGGKNPTDVSFASIGSQVMLFDTIMCFQQSLGALAAIMTDNEKKSVRKECEKFIKNNPNLSSKFNLCVVDEQDWVLQCLLGGKGTIPYEIIPDFNSLNITPEPNELLKKYQFNSDFKDGTISDQEYENVKKFCQLMKLKDLGELNKIYNFQDTVIICEIFEQRSGHLQKLFKYNPPKCNSASSFSGCVHTDKIKCMIALPTEAEHVRVSEKNTNWRF